jgi:protoporphyrinogen/coproporphyrinogen III oxidase
MNQKSTEITIIGGGLTGLTLGYYLTKAGKKVTILEKENRVGGVIHTAKEDEFTYETGPNSGVLGSVEIVSLFEELEGKCQLELANPKSKRRLILKNAQWSPLPSGPKQALQTKLFTSKDKFRILLEPFRKRGINSFETVSELVLRRLGKSFLDYAVDPFISGIYAGNPAQLVTQYALPKLYNLEQKYGSFIIGAIKKKSEPKTELEKKANREVFSVKGGLQNLIHALESEIDKQNIIAGCMDLSIEPDKDGYLISATIGGQEQIIINTTTVVTTTGGYALHSMLPFADESLLKPILDLQYAKVIQVICCYKQWKGKPLNAFGGLIPSKENRRILGILFTSSIFSERAPEGGAILSVFIGGIRKPEMITKSDEEIKQIVLSEISSTLRCNEQPDIFRIFRYQNAIPQYDQTSKDRLEAIDAIEKKHPGLKLAGNIRDGIGVADRVKQAKYIANDLITQLHG